MTQSFEKLARKIDPQSKFLRAWTLTGGISAQVTAMEIVRGDGQTQKMIVRRHGDADFESNPRVAADEFKLTQILKNAGVAVPAPLYLDESLEIFDRPVLVIEFIDGKTEFSPANVDEYMRQMAVSLAGIHKISSPPTPLPQGARGANTEDGGVFSSATDVSFLPRHANMAAEILQNWPEDFDDSLDEKRIREILEAAPEGNPHGLLHGDFWPGNVLWRDGQLAAVIDWEDAALGDPLLDVANARLEILWSMGVAAMENFTRQYQSLNVIDFSGLPYWDVCVALRNLSKIGGWGLDAAAEQKMRDEIRWFVGQAVGG